MHGERVEAYRRSAGKRERARLLLLFLGLSHTHTAVMNSEVMHARAIKREVQTRVIIRAVCLQNCGLDLRWCSRFLKSQ